MGNQVARTAQRTTSSKVIPPSERNDRWLTPLPIIEALTVQQGLDRFSLDPAGAPEHDTAKRIYTLEGGDDGLTDDWFGRVWCNPPYGREMKLWVQKMLEYTQVVPHALWTGTMLIPANTGTKVWQDLVLPHASAIMFWRHRINFQSRDDTTGKGMVSVQASAIVAFGQLDADALWGTVENELLPGSVTDYTGAPR